MIDLKYSINFKQSSVFKGRKQPPRSWINFENVIYDPDNGINDRVLLSMKYGGKANKFNDDVSFSTINPSDLNDSGMQLIKNAYDFLESTNRYNMPSFDDIVSDLINAKDDEMPKGLDKEINDNVDNLYIEFMQKLRDPKVQLLLKSIGQYQLATNAYGWKFSMKNLMSAYSQKPDATFLQTRSSWRHRFNRDVVKGAKAVFLPTPVYNDRKQLGGSEMRDLMNSVGYGKDDTYYNVGSQRKTYLDVMSDYYNGDDFNMKAYYDVSDTYVIPGMEDLWNTEPGFISNITGKLNTAALKDMEDRRPIDSTVSPSDLYNNEEGNIDLLNNALIRGIKSKYSDIKVIKNGDSELEFENNLTNLADYLLMTKSKIAKKENRDESINIVKGFIYCFTKLRPQYVLSKMSGDVLSKESYLELKNIINSIISLINTHMAVSESKSMNEGKIPMLDSLEQMLDLIGVNKDELKDTFEDVNESLNKKLKLIKELFNNELNKINKHTYYNDKYI